MTPDVTTPEQLASSVPIAKRCVSRRAFTISVKRRFKRSLRSAVVTVNGKRVRTLKARQTKAPITSRGCRRAS